MWCVVCEVCKLLLGHIYKMEINVILWHHRAVRGADAHCSVVGPGLLTCWTVS